MICLTLLRHIKCSYNSQENYQAVIKDFFCMNGGNGLASAVAPTMDTSHRC